jgi:hypothetical protein
MAYATQSPPERKAVLFNNNTLMKEHRVVIPPKTNNSLPGFPYTFLSEKKPLNVLLRSA